MCIRNYERITGILDSASFFYLSCGVLLHMQPICTNFTEEGDPANGPCGSGCLCSPAIQQGGLTLDTCNATEGSPGYGYCSHSGELYSEVGPRCRPLAALACKSYLGTRSMPGRCEQLRGTNPLNPVLFCGALG